MTILTNNDGATRGALNGREYVTPGRVLSVPYDDRNRSWVYVVHREGDTVHGVLFENVRDAARVAESAEWTAYTLPLGMDPLTHPLSVVASWAPGLAQFLVGIAPAEDGPGETRDQAYRRGVNDGRASASREFDAWKERAEALAHEYADNNDLCSEFDRCMEEVGLSPRGGHTYRIVVDVTLPRGRDPWDMDLDDLYSESEDTTMVDVSRV